MTDAAPEGRRVYRADPGGIFASDVHRRVLGHLSTPDDDFGYKTSALFARLDADEHTVIATVEELGGVLNDLVKDGLAIVHDIDGAPICQQTPKGFEKLIGPIADEPPPGAKPVRPARLDAPTSLKAEAKAGARAEPK